MIELEPLVEPAGLVGVQHFNAGVLPQVVVRRKYQSRAIESKSVFFIYSPHTLTILRVALFLPTPSILHLLARMPLPLQKCISWPNFLI